MKLIKNSISIFFLLFMSVNFILFFCLKKQEVDLIKNCENATFPIYNTDSNGIYVKKIINYFNDHFPFKNSYITYVNLIKGKYLQSLNVTQKVIIGKNNWLFFNSTIYDDNGLNEYCGFNNWDSKTITKIKTNLDGIKIWCFKHSIAFEVIICPNKQTIYPEFLPNIYLKKYPNRLNQLLNCYKSTINLQPILMGQKLKKPKQLLYYKTDTHWNPYAANIAALELRKKLIFQFPYIDSLEFTKKDSVINHGYDLANMLSLKEYYKDTSIILNFKNKNPKKIKHLVILSDSFSQSMEGSLNQLFSKITSMQLYNDGIPSPQFLLNNKTDVFIIELVERYKEVLSNPINDDYFKN